MVLRSPRRPFVYLLGVALIFLISLYYWVPQSIPGQPSSNYRSPSSNLANLGPSKFVPGWPKPQGSTYTRTLVIGRLESEDVSWIDETDLDIEKAIYVVDKPSLSPDHVVPKNKGHEAMVYLTYIIDHYDNLSDTTIFMHPHRQTWHNNNLLDSDALLTIKHMSDAHIARVGYFNTRCHHEPGCPDWLHLDRPDTDLDTYRKMEEKSFSLDVWHELHPNVPAPYAISQPCCAQFAVSKARILANPREEYIRYRKWLLKTPLNDVYSGRIMEYTWQYLFTGLPELCPAMHVCYCDGYGVCFGGDNELQSFLDRSNQTRYLRLEANEIVNVPGREVDVMRMRIEAGKLDAELARQKEEAFEKGKDPRERAKECGRDWRVGDGY